MARNCDRLSVNARKIFDKIKPYFPDDSYGARQWTVNGQICDNGTWYDLCQSDARKFLIQKQESFLGHLVGLNASMYRRKNGGSLEGFSKRNFTLTMQHHAELLLLYEDIDFQIETLDSTD